MDHYIIDEYPTKAITSIADILIIGKKQGHKPNSWRSIDPTEHIYAAIGHAISALRRKSDEPHLEQALCRLAMAVDIIKRSGTNDTV